MRKILNSNVFLAFVLVILLSIIGYILFDEYERNKNIKILNNIVKREKDLQNVKAACEALLKDMEEEENIKAKNDNSNSDIKNSKDDNKENKKPEDDNNDIINSKDDSSNSNIKISEDDNKENIILEKEDKLANESDRDIIRKSIDELNNIINENNAQIIDIFHKKARISKEDREKLEKINETFSKVLDNYADIYKQVSLRKKKSLEMEEGDTEKEK